MHDPTCTLCDKLRRTSSLPAAELVWEFPHSIAFLGPWQFYEGYCVLVSKSHAAELNELEDAARRGFLDEMCLLAKAIQSCFAPHKLNYELLGNQVRHLHWHIFPRAATDPDRLRPVWFALDRAENDAAEKQRLQTGSLSREETSARLRAFLAATTSP